MSAPRSPSCTIPEGARSLKEFWLARARKVFEVNDGGAWTVVHEIAPDGRPAPR